MTDTPATPPPPPTLADRSASLRSAARSFAGAADHLETATTILAEPLLVDTFDRWRPIGPDLIRRTGEIREHAVAIRLTAQVLDEQAAKLEARAAEEAE